MEGKKKYNAVGWIWPRSDLCLSDWTPPRGLEIEFNTIDWASFLSPLYARCEWSIHAISKFGLKKTM